MAKPKALFDKKAKEATDAIRKSACNAKQAATRVCTHMIS